MKVIDEKIIVENGLEYRVKTYSNGAVVKEMVSVPAEPTARALTQADRIEANVSYLSMKAKGSATT